jgi:hypothetical protein
VEVMLDAEAHRVNFGEIPGKYFARMGEREDK